MIAVSLKEEEANEMGEPMPRVDTRLIAAVETAAGEQVHEAASLIQSYNLWCGMARRSPENAGEAHRMAQLAKFKLREFLARRLLGRSYLRSDAFESDRPRPLDRPLVRERHGMLGAVPPGGGPRLPCSQGRRVS